MCVSARRAARLCGCHVRPYHISVCLVEGLKRTTGLEKLSLQTLFSKWYMVEGVIHNHRSMHRRSNSAPLAVAAVHSINFSHRRQRTVFFIAKWDTPGFIIHYIEHTRETKEVTLYQLSFCFFVGRGRTLSSGRLRLHRRRHRRLRLTACGRLLLPAVY